MDCRKLGLPVHHQLLELTQTHVHQVGDAIQPSHLLLSPSPPTLNPSQHQGLSNDLVLCIRWPKYWSFSFSISPCNEYSGLISFRMTGWISLLSKGLSQSSPTPQFKNIKCSALSFLHSPTLTSIYDHWENHSLDQTDLCLQSNVCCSTWFSSVQSLSRVRLFATP